MEAALTVASNVDPERLAANVDALVAVQLADEGDFDAPFGLQHKHDDAAVWLTQAFTALGLAPVVEVVDEDGIVSRNVYVDLVGQDHPDELVLITAHHDTWYAGADDNSSGVAALLEVARLLAGERLDRTVRVLSFDQEEVALVGSTRHFRDHASDDVIAQVNLDCIAYASSEPGSQSAPLGFVMPDVGDFAMVLANDAGLDLAVWSAELAPRLPHPVGLGAAIAPGDADWPATASFHRSDQSAAWLLGIPAAFVSDTADLRNPHYHTPGDTPDTLDAAFFRSNVELTVAMAMVLQEAP